MKTKEEKVYFLLTKIPKGKVTTYGSIAAKLGISAREVGKILIEMSIRINFHAIRL